MVTHNRGRILLIDDDEPTRRVINLIAVTDGFDLTAVPNRDEALTLLQEGFPDAIVMDFRVGGMEPEVFIEQARAFGYAGPILLCTAMQRDFDLAVDGVLYKPFYPEEFTRTLTALIDSHRNN